MDECHICFGENWVVKTPCKHLLCLDCLIKLRQDMCPTCRRPLLNSLPIEIRMIANMNTTPTRSTGLNIHNRDDFPSLS